jgi:hypothetical protein
VSVFPLVVVLWGENGALTCPLGESISCDWGIEIGGATISKILYPILRSPRRSRRNLNHNFLGGKIDISTVKLG